MVINQEGKRYVIVRARNNWDVYSGRTKLVNWLGYVWRRSHGWEYRFMNGAQGTLGKCSVNLALGKALEAHATRARIAYRD